MAAIDFIYIDPDLQTNFDPAIHQVAADAANGESKDGIAFYIGHPTLPVRVESNPGVDLIICSLVDASPGAGVEVANIKLALSAAGLDTAVAGDPMNVGTTVQPGSVNAAAVHFRYSSTQPFGTSTEISISIPPLVGG